MIFPIVAAIDYLVQYQEGSGVIADIVIGDFKVSLKSTKMRQSRELNKMALFEHSGFRKMQPGDWIELIVALV